MSYSNSELIKRRKNSMLKANDWQHITKSDLYELIKNGKIETGRLYIHDGQLMIDCGLIGICDIAIEAEFIDAIRFYAGG